MFFLRHSVGVEPDSINELYAFYIDVSCLMITVIRHSLIVGNFDTVVI